MKIKEISQKYSEALFYATIILFIVSVALAITLLNASKRPSNFRNNLNGERNGAMQNGDDFRQNKRFNRMNNSTNSVDTQQNETDNQGPTPSDTNTTETVPAVQ